MRLFGLLQIVDWIGAASKSLSSETVFQETSSAPKTWSPSQWEAIGANWKELLRAHKFVAPTCVDYEPTVVSTLNRIWWALPWMVIVYVVVLLSLTLCLVNYLAHLERTTRGKAPFRRRRLQHRRQIQNQFL